MILLFQLLSYQGEVQVLNAPIFSIPDITSTIRQYLRKGEKIYIYDPDMTDSIKITEEFDADIDILQDEKRFVPEDFYLTIDRLGHDAYVLRKHVQIIYNDSRDLDPQEIVEDTDYRLKEPLPAGYPFIWQHERLANTTFSIGNTPNLVYDEPILLERILPTFGINIRYLKRLKKIYLGGYYGLRVGITDLTFSHYHSNGAFFDIYAGPSILAPIYQKEKTSYFLSFAIPFRSLIHMMSINGESQSFSGFNVGVQMGVDYLYEFSETFKLTLGIEFGYLPSFSLKLNNKFHSWLGGDKAISSSAILFSGTIGLTIYLDNTKS